MKAFNYGLGVKPYQRVVRTSNKVPTHTGTIEEACAMAIKDLVKSEKARPLVSIGAPRQTRTGTSLDN